MTPLLLTAIAGFGLALSPLWDYDVWWQLACGKALSSLHGFPAHDLFSFTPTSRPWDSNEWLSQLLFYGTWRLGGLTLLTIGKATIAAILATTLYLDATKGTTDNSHRRAAFAWCTVAIYIMRWSLVERPQVLSMSMLALEMSLLRSGQSKKYLVLLTLAWANLHGASVLLCPGVLLLWLLTESMTAKSSRPIVRGIPVLAACMLAILCNPMGIRLYAYPFVTMHYSQYMAHIAEWLPPTFADDSEFLLWLGAAGIVIGTSWRSVALTEKIIGSAMLYLAFSARRHIPLAIIMLTPTIARASLSRFSPAIRRRISFAGAALAAMMVVAAKWRGVAMTLGVTERLYPSSAISALDDISRACRNKKPAKIFSMYEWGGYLTWSLWPACRVFIDGRQYVYGQELFEEYQEIVSGSETSTALLKEYGPDVFVLNRMASLNRILAGSPEHALVHFDDACNVYVRISSFSDQWLAAHAYTVVNPDPQPGSSVAAIMHELTRAAWEAPRDSRPWIIRAKFLLTTDDPKASRAAVHEALTRRPHDVDALITAFTVAAAQSEWPTAGQFAREAASEDPEGVAPQLALARIAEQRGDKQVVDRLIDRALDRSVAREERTGRVEPGLTAAWESRARRKSGSAAAEAWRRAGMAAIGSGAWDAALRDFEKGLSIASTNPGLQYGAGVALDHLGRFQEAEAMLNNSVACDPNQARSYIALGITLGHLRQHTKALKAFQQALTIDPNNLEARLQLKLENSPRRVENRMN